jgi:hypothetical protein
MALMDGVKRLFTGKKRLSKVTPDEIRRERIRLEQIEQRVGKEIDELERRKQELFVKGKGDVTQRQQVGLARKIKELDVAVRAKDKQIALVSRQMRVLSGLTMIKENEALARDLGVSSIVSKMDLGELQQYVEKATIDGQFQMERLAEILGTLEGPLDQDLGMAEDADTMAIVAAMQEARESEVTDPDAIAEGMKQVNEILSAGSDDEEALGEIL